MAKMLMVTWDGAGCSPPEHALLRELVTRGHRLNVLSHDVHRSQVEAEGAVFVPYRSVRQLDSAVPGIDETMWEHLVFAPGVADDFASAIADFQPDVLLVDCALVTALGAARDSGLPTVALFHTVYSLSETPEFGQFKAPVEGCDLILAFGYRAFDPALNPPSHLAYVGPLRPDSAAADSWRRRSKGHPLVVVSLSTGHQYQEALLQRLCDALGDLDVEALVTTGRGVDPESLTAKENVCLQRFVSHQAVLGEADLLVTHAGHGTAMAGLTFGVPLLCLPMGRDQGLVAARVAELGLGLSLDQNADVAELARAVRSLLADEPLKQRSREFARRLEGLSDAGRAADLVEGVVAVARVA